MRLRLAAATCAMVLVAAISLWPAAGGAGAAATPSPTGFVHAVLGPQGGQLLDGAGQPFQFKGVQLECWLLGGGPCWGGGWTTETQTYAGLATLMGTDGAEAFRSQLYANFVSEGDIARMAQLGFNTVRVAVNHVALDSGAQAGWSALDNLLGWADRYNIKVIIDMHAAPSAQSKAGNADYNGGSTLWDPDGRRADTVALWTRIAARYSNRTAIAGYDLLNEPSTGGHGELLVSLYRQLIAGIRSVDKNHLVLVEGDGASYDLSPFLASGALDSNQAYAFHTYDPMHSDNALSANAVWRQIQYMRAYSQKQGIPVINDEFGLNTNHWVQMARTAFENPSYGIRGWSFWSWKGPYRPGSYAATHDTAHLIEQYIPSMAWSMVINYATVAGSPKPTPAQVTQGVSEFFSTVNIANTTETPTLLQALGLKSGQLTAPLLGS